VDDAPAIEAIGISRSFGGVRALHEASFSAGFGEIHALVGENGAGKSTLIKIMCGVLRPDAGTLRLRGEEVQLSGPADAQARGIGTVFQELSLMPWMTVAENLLLRDAPRGRGGLIRRRALAARADEILGAFGVEGIDPLDLVSSVSVGQRQIIEIVRALRRRPAVLFLDEPTLGLDPVQRRRIWEYLRRLPAESGTTLFLTTHYLEEADPCDRVAIVDHGAIVASGEPAFLKQELGRESVELRTEHPERLAARVRELTGVGPHRAPHGLSLFVHDAASVLPLLLPLSREEVEVRVTRPTLEDVFVALTARPSTAAA
jgi:ABC-type sugar transport system ATPase subunit